MTQQNTDIDITVKLDYILRAQKTAHLKDPYPSVSVRQDRLSRVLDLTVRNEKKICDAVNADFENRSSISTQALDILPVLQAYKHAKKHVSQWMKTEKRKSNFPLGLLGAKSTVEYIPLGVVGNIAPWNFPIQLSLMPFAEVFAAGNRGMLKPSELSPETSNLMAELVSENFNEDEFAVIQGGVDVSKAFAGLPFDHLLFTGSTQVGRQVASIAAPNLVPMTLELGGKNPVIVSRSADLKLAADKIMWAKTMNGGQICLCPDTVYVANERIDEFVEHCKSAVEAMYPDIDKNEDYIHIISQRHADRLVELVTDAEEKGATVIRLGNSNNRRVPPSIVLNADPNSRICQEEIFGGPLLVKPFDELAKIVDTINQGESPLALYYFGNNKQEIKSLTLETRSGGMVVNDLLAHCLQENLPFGGMGKSGMGVYHGFDGFKNFSHGRAVYHQSNLDPLKMIRPPFSPKLRAYVKEKIKA
ncbi:coniferyl aldehyde dehydrogenase [Spongiibacter sp. KMU-166]|uniref:Aldehyde dehydrogenase n=1 Tax=Spongiibacter thalassae TaxID=2721624 RepID=A0ABX1G9N8_9GAMM|nr:coniferyl aldehyde dehydrogenase [Spongiibacter thalassae]NKI15874.1 coniferyl aldehyde dehydrogenase [Spongiibacter thalassae]